MHAELSASSSERWMNCPGSVALSRGQPDEASEYALEGTVAHGIAERALKLDANPAVWLGETIKDVYVDEEMVEAVQVFVELVRTQLAEEGTEAEFEHKFSLAALKPPAPMYGMADAVLFVRPQRLLIVDDFKYGAGILVDPTENSQLMYYALGALLAWEKKYGPGLVDTVRMVIVQPRAAHPDGVVRSSEIGYDDLVGFAVDLLRRAQAALEPDAPRVPGAWCRFCRAKAVCPTLKEASLEVARTEFDEPHPPAPDTLPPEVLSDVLNKASLLEDWLRAVRERVQWMLEQGQDVPGWKVVAKRATRKWIQEQDVINWCLAHSMAPDQFLEEPKLRSPAQMEKVLKPLKLALPEDLYSKVSSGNTIAPAHDKRPALACSPADDFSALPPGTPPRSTEEVTPQ